jgi:hypothetical protein
MTNRSSNSLIYGSRAICQAMFCVYINVNVESGLLCNSQQLRNFWPLGGDLKTAQQGCQMVYFRTKNRNLGKFWRTLQWKMLVYFMDFWSIL